MATMATLSVPVALISEDTQCTKILEVTTDGMSTLSDFQRQLSVGLLRSGKLLGDIRFRGNPVVGDGRLHHYAAANSKLPRFTAAYKDVPPGATRQLYFVKAATGKIVSLIYKPHSTVHEVKRQLQDKVEVPVHQQRLLLSGKQLGDSNTLQESNVSIGSTLHLVLAVQGGLSSAPFKFVDVSDSNALERQEFSDRAPGWRGCIKGVNLEGYCQNEDCKAYKDLVIDPVGHGSFSLTADKAHCPACSNQFQPTACGFFGCWWMYDGRKAGRQGPQDISGTWQEVGGDAYYGFKEATNIVDWYSLVLSTRPKSALGKPFKVSSECLICWEPLFGACASARCTTRCKHTFHAGCLDTWKSHMPKEGCPMCRESL